MFKGKAQTGSKEETVFSSLQTGLFTSLCAWEVEDGYPTASKFTHYRSLMVMTTNSQQRKWLLWCESGDRPCTVSCRQRMLAIPDCLCRGEGSIPRTGSLLYWLVSWTYTPADIHGWDRCSDKCKCQPTAAPSSGVAGWAGWNPTVKSHPQAEQQHLTDSLGDSNTSLKRVINSFLHLSSLLTYQYVVISYHFSAFFGNSLWPTLPTGAIVLVVQVPVFWCKYAQTCVRNKMLSSLWSAFHFLILVPFCGLPSKGWTKWYYSKTECENKCKFLCGSRQVRPEVNLGHTLNQFFVVFFF